MKLIEKTLIAALLAVFTVAWVPSADAGPGHNRGRGHHQRFHTKHHSRHYHHHYYRQVRPRRFYGHYFMHYGPHPYHYIPRPTYVYRYYYAPGFSGYYHGRHFDFGFRF